MKIDSATLGMDSARRYTAATYSYRRFELRDYSNVNSGPKGNEQKDDAENENSGKPVTSTSFMSLNDMDSLREKMSKVRYDFKVRTGEMRDRETIRQESIKYIFELLFGRHRERFKKWIEEHSAPTVGQETGIGAYRTDNSIDALFTNQDSSKGQPFNVAVSSGQPAASGGLAMSYEHAEYQYESEDTTFSAMGTVKTADGRELKFNIDVAMSREFESYYEERTRVNAGMAKGTPAALCDPLVINLEGNIASVSDQKIRFDIDGDGEIDTINQLSRGSGYLALDKNGDGKINDGTELFGTSSGDGFADLAKYDEDGNGWIDENDEIWNKLKVMTYDENGKECLYTLAQTGVGAICLNKLATDFSQKDNNHATQSVIRSTGIFLYESGAVGTVQHLDVAKYRQEA